ncbi:hypothetical protein FRC07_011194, partial [Ceratobasidium sp. 392]
VWPSSNYRSYLRLGSPVYRHLVEDIQDNSKHDYRLFESYFDLGLMAWRFDLADIARWAWPRVGTVLNSVVMDFATTECGNEWWQEVLSYYEAIREYAPNVANELLGIFRLCVSMPLGDRLVTTQEEPQVDIKTCVALYKGSSPLPNPVSAMILGYTFVVLLSLGHNSDVWKNQLTRDERSVFYTAQAHLVSLDNNPNLDLAWLKNPNASTLMQQICRECESRFDSLWSKSFGLLGTFGSPLPLADVCKLARLPQCRYLFAEAVRKPDWSCRSGCGERMVRRIDKHMGKLFSEQMVAIYKELVA